MARASGLRREGSRGYCEDRDTPTDALRPQLKRGCGSAGYVSVEVTAAAAAAAATAAVALTLGSNGYVYVGDGVAADLLRGSSGYIAVAPFSCVPSSQRMPTRPRPSRCRFLGSPGYRRGEGDEEEEEEEEGAEYDLLACGSGGNQAAFVCVGARARGSSG